MKTFNTVWKHVRRSPYQAAAAILTMYLTFLVAGIFFLAMVTSAVVLQYFESKPQITVFFSEKSEKKEADALQKILEDSGKVASVKYVSKEDALSLYREQNKNDPLLLEMVTADILPASLEVSALDPNYLKDLEPLIKKANGVEDVVYQKDVVDALLSWTNAIRLIGGGLAVLLAFDSLLIVMTVINMKIALKREEVEILKLIGATSWYIRSPFVWEGGLYGAVGAWAAWATITAVVLWFGPYLVSFLGVVPVVSTVLSSPASQLFVALSTGFLGTLLVGGFLLGSIGSTLAVGRYLKF